MRLSPARLVDGRCANVCARALSSPPKRRGRASWKAAARHEAASNPPPWWRASGTRMQRSAKSLRSVGGSTPARRSAAPPRHRPPATPRCARPPAARWPGRTGPGRPARRGRHEGLLSWNLPLRRSRPQGRPFGDAFGATGAPRAGNVTRPPREGNVTGSSSADEAILPHTAPFFPLGWQAGALFGGCGHLARLHTRRA
jgi:hypothetical protein